MPSFALDFDVILILILISMVVIGYINGATNEIIKLLKIIIPFLIIFYFSGHIARFIFKSQHFKSMISKISFLNYMQYFNTFIMFLSTIIAFFGSYFVISIVIRFIQKRIQSEIVTYKLGKFNNNFGSILAVVRYYILASILILPFFMLGITTKDKDFTTKIIIENPPIFTRVGYLVNSTEPVLNASNSLSNFFEVVDLNVLKGYYKVITDLPGTLDNYEQEVKNNCSYTTTEVKYPNLYAYVSNPSECNNDNLSSIVPYKGLIIWVSENNIDLANLDNDTLITQFNASYNDIQMNTTDLEMKTKLEKAHSGSQIYLVVNNWLKSELSIDTNDLVNLLDDDNIEKILENLVIEFSNKDSEGLIYDLHQLNNDELDEKLISIEKFVQNYHEIYKPIMDKMQVDLPFKYKLIASTLTKFDFVSSLERSPLMAMYVIDTLKFFNDAGFQLMKDESLYQSIVKIIIPVYIIKPDQNGNVETFSKEDMIVLLNKLDKGLDDVIITDEFIIELVNGLVTANYTDQQTGTTDLYIKYLIDKNQISQEALNELANYKLFNESDDERITHILDVLRGDYGV